MRLTDRIDQHIGKPWIGGPPGPDTTCMRLTDSEWRLIAWLLRLTAWLHGK